MVPKYNLIGLKFPLVLIKSLVLNTLLPLVLITSLVLNTLLIWHFSIFKYMPELLRITWGHI